MRSKVKSFYGSYDISTKFISARREYLRSRHAENALVVQTVQVDHPHAAPDDQRDLLLGRLEVLLQAAAKQLGPGVGATDARGAGRYHRAAYALATRRLAGRLGGGHLAAEHAGRPVRAERLGYVLVLGLEAGRQVGIQHVLSEFLEKSIQRNTQLTTNS